MRTLMISHYMPYPLHSGAEIRNYNILKRLSRENDVWILGFVDKEYDPEYLEPLRSFCTGVETVEMEEMHALEHPWQAVEYICKGKPIELRYYHSQAMVDKIQELAAKYNFDVVEIEDSFMGLYLEALPANLQKRSLMTFHDVVFNKQKLIASLESRWQRRFRMWLYGRMMYRWEPFYMERFGRCITVSEADKQLLLSRNPRLQVDVVPNGVDTQQFQMLPRNDTSQMVLYVGNMGYPPNVDAVTYFCKQILPLIKEKAPNVEVCIVGLNPADEVLALAGEGVRVTGTVEDLSPYYEQSAVCIVPLRGGGGTRLKIMEAMSFGRPVVSTSIGCEGLAVKDGENIFIADSPEVFAAKTLQLLNEPVTWKKMVIKGRELVEQKYDWDVIARQLLTTYQEVARKP